MGPALCSPADEIVYRTALGSFGCLAQARAIRHFALSGIELGEAPIDERWREEAQFRSVRTRTEIEEQGSICKHGER